MTEYIYTSQGDGVQKAPVKGNAIGSPVALSAGGTSLLGATIGTTVLVAGAKTVANTSITATTKIFAQHMTLGTVTAAKLLTITRSNGVSFTITSTDGTDTSTIVYLLIP